MMDRRAGCEHRERDRQHEAQDAWERRNYGEPAGEQHRRLVLQLRILLL